MASAPALSGSGTPNGGDLRTVEVDGLSTLAHKPMLVLVERDPWLMVIGSDVPTVVLYEDGLAIYHRGQGQTVQALTARAPEQVRRVMTELVGSGLMTVPVRSSVSLTTDQPRVSLLLRSGTRWKYAEVYGIDRNGRPSHGSGSGQNNPAPPAFVEAYKKLVAFDAPAATPWVPDQIEVMLWDFAHTKLPARRWPTEIPPPPAGTKLPDKGVFKHFIAARYEPAVKSFVGSLGMGEAVAVNGRPASIGYRRVVPEEAYIEQVRTCAWRKIVVKPPAATPPGCR